MQKRIGELLEGLCYRPAPKEIRSVPFGEVAWSWIVCARKKLKVKAGAKLNLLSSRAIFDMEKSLVGRIISVSAPTISFILDFQKQELALNGASSKQRYNNFIQKTFFDRENLEKFFEEYSELSRLIIDYLDFWVDQALELINRLDSDTSLLQQTFNDKIGKVTTIKMQAGDTHNKGRSVCILTFQSGFNLVYKPKNLDIVVEFHSLLDWLNTQNPLLQLHGYKVLSRGSYGWESKIEQRPCTNLEQVDRYFQKSGIYLCLIYWLNGVDFHHENIIADGEHPMLIDLETILSTSIASSAKESADDLIQHSVLSTGLLPGMIMRMGIEKGIDISGLANANQGIRRKPRWQNLGTDEIQLSIVDVEPENWSNQVIYAGKVYFSKDYVESIISSFNQMYEFIQQNKPSFDEWISRFQDKPIRMILRSTKAYANLLEDLFDPIQLLNKNLFLQKLDTLKSDYRKMDFPTQIIDEEKRSLLLGDIPFFHTLPSSRDLYSNNKLVKGNCFEESSAEKSRQILNRMSESDRVVQEVFIRQSFSLKTISVHEKITVGKVGTTIPTQEEILQHCKSIGEELLSKAFISENGSLGWIGLEPNLVAEEHYLAPLGESLFSGRMGIALFFSALCRITGNNRWGEAAMSTLKPLRTNISKKKGLSKINNIGGLTGIGGLIYGFSQIGKLLENTSLVDDARTLIQSIEAKHIEEDHQFDFVFGGAGLILSLLSFHKNFPSSEALALATKCGEHICKQAKSTADGEISWHNENKKSYLGLSHGNAGIAYALMKLNNPQFHSTIKGALEYERKRFSSDEKNWPHLANNTFQSSWCHGHWPCSVIFRYAR